MSNLLKVDFGSGYKPKPGYKTCDFVPLPVLDYWYDADIDEIVGLSLGSVDEFHLRNVIHHVCNIDKLCKLLHRYLKNGGIVTVIEPCCGAFRTNYLLDCIYYRFVNYKPEIWFSKEYRDYTKCFISNSFTLILQEALDDVYIKTIFRKE